MIWTHDLSQRFLGFILFSYAVCCFHSSLLCCYYYHWLSPVWFIIIGAGGLCRNRYSSAMLPSSHLASVSIVRFPGNAPVTAVQSPAAILIGWANTLLSGWADTAAIAHCRCWSIPLVVLPVKSTTNTSGLCSSSKSGFFASLLNVNFPLGSNTFLCYLL